MVQNGRKWVLQGRTPILAKLNIDTGLIRVDRELEAGGRARKHFFAKVDGPENFGRL